MFQQFLNLFPTVRIYTGLYPIGGFHDPCRVKCSVCDYDELAVDWMTAKRLAGRHDAKHDDERRLDDATNSDIDLRNDFRRV